MDLGPHLLPLLGQGGGELDQDDNIDISSAQLSPPGGAGNEASAGVLPDLGQLSSTLHCQQSLSQHIAILTSINQSIMYCLLNSKEIISKNVLYLVKSRDKRSSLISDKLESRLSIGSVANTDNVSAIHNTGPVKVGIILESEVINKFLYT